MFRIIHEIRIEKKKPKLSDFLKKIKEGGPEMKPLIVEKIRMMYSKEIKVEEDDIKYEGLMQRFHRI